VNICKCAGAGSLLLSARVTGGSAEHPTLSDENDMSVGELLLQLPGKPCESPHIDINIKCSLV